MASKVQQALGRPLTDAQLASAIRRGSVGVVRETGHTLYSAGLVKHDRPATSGLYYYALPSSRDKLDLGKVLSARNKIDAALLLGMPERTVAKEAGYKRDGWKLQGYSEAGFLEVVRKYDPRSVLDQFDRPIAQAAKKQGYDTIILHREATGHGSLATEVVDLSRVRVNPKRSRKGRPTSNPRSKYDAMLRPWVRKLTADAIEVIEKKYVYKRRIPERWSVDDVGSPYMVYEDIKFKGKFIQVGLIASHSNELEFAGAAVTDVDSRDVWIWISVRTPQRTSRASYELVYERMTEILRHEFEHAIQEISGREVPKIVEYVDYADSGSAQDFRRNIDTDIEIEAYVTGLYMTAKKARRPFWVLLDDFIKQTRKRFGSSVPDDEIDEWAFKLVDYAKKRYPALRDPLRTPRKARRRQRKESAREAMHSNPKKTSSSERDLTRWIRPPALTKFVDKLKGWGVSPRLELEEGGRSAFIFMTGGPWWRVEVKSAQDLYDKVLYPTGKKTGFFQDWDIVDIKAEKTGKRLTGEFIVRVGPSEAPVGEFIKRGLGRSRKTRPETEKYMRGAQSDIFAPMRKHMRHGPGGFVRGEDPTLDNPKKKKMKKNPEGLVPVADIGGEDARHIYEGRRTLWFETPSHFFNVIITLDRHPRTTGELRDEVAISLVKSETDVDVVFEELYPPTGTDDERVQRYLKSASAWLRKHGPQLMRKRIHAVNPKASGKLSWVQDHTGIYMAEHGGGGLTYAGQRGDLVVARSTRGWDVVFEPFGGVAIDLGSAKTLAAGKRKAEIAITGKKAKKKAKETAKKKAARKTTPEWQRLINRCQKLWEHYCERPGKKRLKDVLAHLEKMKSSTSAKVKAERRRCLRSARSEARKLKVKV